MKTHLLFTGLILFTLCGCTRDRDVQSKEIIQSRAGTYNVNFDKKYSWKQLLDEAQPGNNGFKFSAYAPPKDDITTDQAVAYFSFGERGVGIARTTRPPATCIASKRELSAMIGGANFYQVEDLQWSNHKYGRYITWIKGSNKSIYIGDNFVFVGEDGYVMDENYSTALNSIPCNLD